MNGFDRFCAFFAALLGVALLVLGAIGLFVGCSAQFTLPPVVGVAPAFIGWGVLRSIYVALKYYPRQSLDADSPGEVVQE